MLARGRCVSSFSSLTCSLEIKTPLQTAFLTNVNFSYQREMCAVFRTSFCENDLYSVILKLHRHWHCTVSNRNSNSDHSSVYFQEYHRNSFDVKSRCSLSLLSRFVFILLEGMVKSGLLGPLKCCSSFS